MSAVASQNSLSYPIPFQPKIEICDCCNRPLCPHCWNHANLISKQSYLWQCSNPNCRTQIQKYVEEC